MHNLLDIPFTLLAHCNILINDTMLVITGGAHENPDPDLRLYHPTNQSYFYNKVKNIWIPGPPLKIKRMNHGCGLIRCGEKQFLMVTGGVTPNKNNQDIHELVDSVEFLHLDTLEWYWQMVPRPV